MANPYEKKLALTRWFSPALEWHGRHLEACRNLEVEAEPFEKFAEEVLNTPEDKRDWLLTVEPLGNVEGFTRFRQYETPLQKEMVTGLFYRDYRKGRKK